jgi:AraC-like DNA-binding protein
VNTNAGPYVNVPDFLDLKDKNLQYLDALIYVTIKSFNDTSSDICFPSHETIAKRAGMSTRFVIDSIKRLEAYSLIKVERSKDRFKKRASNYYCFIEGVGKMFHTTKKIPTAIFDAKELTANEKAMMICLRQFFNHGLLTSIWTVSEYAKRLGLSYSIVKKQFDSLVVKGFITESQKLLKSLKKSNKVYKFSNKINWDYWYLDKPKELIQASEIKQFEIEEDDDIIKAA